MNYNEFLLKLVEAIKIFRSKNNPNYVPPEVFNSITELVYLENTCAWYGTRINELNSEEFKNFTGLAKANNGAREKIMNEYKTLYNAGKIDKSKFLSEYENASDCVAALLLDELKEDFFTADFLSVLNNVIGVKKYIENDVLLNKFKDCSFYKQELDKKPEDIGKVFRLLLREFMLLSSIYAENGLSGINLYALYNGVLKELNIAYDMIDINERLNKVMMDPDASKKDINNVIEDSKHAGEDSNNLISIYSGMKNNNDWFSNQYLPLVVNLTSDYSILKPLVDEPKLRLSVASFINHLEDKEFLSMVTCKDGNKVVFNDVSNLIKEIGNYEVSDKTLNPQNYIQAVKNIDRVFDSALSGNIKLSGNTRKY